MNATGLVEAIVRQTMVLISQLATHSGLRAPLAHVADRVLFLHGGVIAGAVTRGAQTAETFAQAILDGWRQR